MTACRKWIKEYGVRFISSLVKITGVVQTFKGKTHTPAMWFISLVCFLKEGIQGKVWHLLEGRMGYLIPSNMVLPWKLIAAYLVKTLPLFYGTSRIITELTKANHCTLSWTSGIQSTNLYSVFKIHVNIIINGFKFIYMIIKFKSRRAELGLKYNT
jgi:hypothetical protein